MRAPTLYQDTLVTIERFHCIIMCWCAVFEEFCLYTSYPCVIGWESQLLEMGFLAMFMCPILNLSQFPRHTPTSWTTILGNRWMIFRIMLGAVCIIKKWLQQYNDSFSHWQGLIKIRGDQCWRDLTCMNYHYEVYNTSKVYNTS